MGARSRISEDGWTRPRVRVSGSATSRDREDRATRWASWRSSSLRCRIGGRQSALIGCVLAIPAPPCSTARWIGEVGGPGRHSRCSSSLEPLPRCGSAPADTSPAHEAHPAVQLVRIGCHSRCGMPRHSGFVSRSVTPRAERSGTGTGTPVTRPLDRKTGHRNPGTPVTRPLDRLIGHADTGNGDSPLLPVSRGSIHRSFRHP